MSPEAETQRLFFALWPDDELRARLASLAREVPRGRSRGVHPDDLHATLVFLGQVQSDRLACVEAAADRVRAGAFGFDIEYVDYWFRPRILWCGPRHTPEEATALVVSLQDGLLECGFKPEHRPYRLHVTLARHAPIHRPWELEKPLCWQVHDFVLVRSRPQGDGPYYEVLKRWPLDS